VIFSITFVIVVSVSIVKMSVQYQETFSHYLMLCVFWWNITWNLSIRF